MSGLRIIAGIAALAVLGALATLALPRGLADLAAFEPRQALRHAERRFPAPTDAQWAQGREQLRAALAHEPGNPALLESLAHWLDRGARGTAADDAAARAYRQQALELQRRASVLRPAWPFAWASIALLKIQLQEFDAELARAATNAARLGPWEPEVQLVLAEVLFAASERLPGPARAAAGSVVVNGLKLQDERIFARASTLGRLHVLCALPGVARSRHAVRCI